MSAVASFNIGKCRVVIEAKGCIDCGTESASGWKIAKQLGAVVGRQVVVFTVRRCSACAETPGEQLALAPIGGS